MMVENQGKQDIRNQRFVAAKRYIPENPKYTLVKGHYPQPVLKPRLHASLPFLIEYPSSTHINMPPYSLPREEDQPHPQKEE